MKVGILALMDSGNLAGAKPVVLLKGNDFYAYPRLSQMVEDWPGLNGVTQICHVIVQSFGLARYPQLGK